jgi:hypothetical protein
MSALFLIFMISKFHLLLVSLRGTCWLFVAAISFLHVSGFSQENSRSAFALLNIIPQNLPIKIALDTNEITSAKEAIPPGFYTGFIPWNPAKATLTAETPGYRTAELKPFLKSTETPLIVLKETSDKVLEFIILANSKERAPSFYDAINLTSQENLTIRADNKDVTLPRNQRIRLSKAKSLSFSVLGGEVRTIDPSEQRNYLMVFYNSIGGLIECFVTFDNPV